MATINFLGDNPLTLALGPAVSNVILKFNDGQTATIKENGKATVVGELYQATVVNKNGTSPTYKVTAGFTFPKTATATATFSAAKTIINVNGIEEIGGELTLIG